MKVAILGSGANGASIGADLAEAGLDVTLIDQWPAHVEAMRARGVRIEMPERTLEVAVDAATCARWRSCASPSTSSSS
jgi:2-dehydropantoate 2-reductase